MSDRIDDARADSSAAARALAKLLEREDLPVTREEADLLTDIVDLLEDTAVDALFDHREACERRHHRRDTEHLWLKPPQRVELEVRELAPATLAAARGGK